MPDKPAGYTRVTDHAAVELGATNLCSGSSIGRDRGTISGPGYQ